jgi:response regulator of citrate/malate metabolism
MRLLLVEDNAKIVHAIRYIIETEFRETIRHTLRVATVREGVAALAAFRPDILLFDVALPDGEGFELLNAQSREDFLISVCMSALPPKDLIKKTSLYGVFRVLLKPFDGEELSAALREATAESL